MSEVKTISKQTIQLWFVSSPLLPRLAVSGETEVEGIGAQVGGMVMSDMSS